MVREDTGDSGERNAHECFKFAELMGTAKPVNTHCRESTDTDLQHDRSEGWPPLTVKRHQHKHSLKRRYEVLETLGKGTYGKVKRAVERKSGITVAIKSIRKERISDDLDRVHIQREIEIVSLLTHPNIIRMHEVFECREKIVMVMEYASGGELYDYIQQRQRLSEIEARNFFRQITSAVHYCHKNGVVHRDLKLENILLDQNLNVKLVDFGLSNHYERGRMLDTFCGSPLYASPEIINGLPYQGPEVDCWALGVLLYALVHGSMPFDGSSYSGLTEQIRQGRFRRPQPPSDACALIGWMLTVRVEDRATVEDVANHWWVNLGFDVSICDCPPAWCVKHSGWDHDPSPSAKGYTTSKRLPSEPHLRLTFHPKRPTSQPPCSTLPRKSRLDKSLSSPRSPISLSPAVSPAHCQAAKMPKKGILKKQYERAAQSAPSENQAGSADISAPPSGKAAYRGEGQGRAEEGRRRKGILKRNGKFTSGAKPTVMTPPSSPPVSFPESLEWDPDPELRNSQQRDMENTQEEELER
ncbi:NUAK family SNF1-like kinase 1 [Alosa pseudoharengus]|uniref:NUAK family SNF1-like kinase 1 n=1 Tax=Alosa pseudoharengus TaxID=34774 RepID=UPI003F89070C